MSPGGHQRIFISYRREETSAHAGRIYDGMVSRFGEENVFMDVEMEPGVDFVDRITEVVSSCTVLIAVIGKDWATAPGPDGSPRLHDEADFVRLEVATAVQNPDVTVIPALVDKAQMPKAEQLPEEMRHLARRNALELSDGRWRYDVGRLNQTLEHLLEGLTGFPVIVDPEPPTPPPEPAKPAPDPRPKVARPPAAQLVIEGIAVAAIAAFVGRWLVSTVPEAHTTAGEITALMLRRIGSWGLTGLAVALWLGARTGRTDFARIGLLGLAAGVLAGAVGGASWALPVLLPDHERGVTNPKLEVLSIAITGGLFGLMIGALWRPPRVAAAVLAGFVAGAVVQLILNRAGVGGGKVPEVCFVFAARAGTVTGFTLITLLALDYQQETEPAREG
ncbi:MAG TPA: toll/interleukin-1 receptor domain-containing protein [Solirubrobacterales bacterium]|nr:toll/interleukin-1 receptor domain-containing protein [Solirubrobacterales bacterium]